VQHLHCGNRALAPRGRARMEAATKPERTQADT